MIRIRLRRCALIALYAAIMYPYYAACQTNQLVIQQQGTIVVHPNASLNIFSNTLNAGTLGSYDNSYINFFGKTWQNQGTGFMPDESAGGTDGIGGIFKFWGLYVGAQRIITQGSQPYNGFPNISIDNTQNVSISGDLYINNNLNFSNGNLLLEGSNVTVGKPGKGTITGYSDKRFIVTGFGITGGYLVRSTTGKQGAIAFPVGTSTSSYTPALINYTGAVQNLKVRVADNVYNKIGFSEYVYKTWVLATDYRDAGAAADITLQHNSADEGAEYYRNRNQSYVSRYDKTVNGFWDILSPSPSVTPGSITTASAVFNSYLNTRMLVKNLEAIEYFTKSVIDKSVHASTPVKIPDAISPNGDGLNDTYVIVKRQPTDKVRLEIYTRNQVLVFRDFDYQDTFNGIGNMGGFLGNKLPDGIYYYLISVNNSKGIPGYLVINR